MRSEALSNHAPVQVLPVYPARAVRAVDGANLGDPFSISDELILGDTYHLAPSTARTGLSVTHDLRIGGFRIESGSDAGRAGSPLVIDGLVTLMSPDGATLEALILVELTVTESQIEQVFLLPLGEMAARVDYTLVTLDRDAAHRRFAETACVSFTAGTRITMANGTQMPVEALRVGDRVLTRDHGVQPIRWLGHQTVRAFGAFAPIRIRAGALHNEGDLVLSPNHRIFVYQRRDTTGAGRAEVLVRARHLVNDDTVTRTSGGFVDYHQMLFDRHEIVFAEGIAAETLLVDQTTRAALPEDVTRGLRGDRNDVARASVVELGERQLGRRAVELLRAASLG